MTLAERENRDADILAEKAFRRRQHQTAQAGAGAAAAGIGDAGNASAASSAASASSRSCSAETTVPSNRSRSRGCLDEPRRVGQALKRILRRNAGHGDRALGEFRWVRRRRGRNACHPLADKNAQRNIVALRRFGAFDLAQAHRNPGRTAAHRDRVGSVGSRLPGGLDKGGYPVDELAGIDGVGHPSVLVVHSFHARVWRKAPPAPSIVPAIHVQWVVITAKSHHKRRVRSGSGIYSLGSRRNDLFRNAAAARRRSGVGAAVQAHRPRHHSRLSGRRRRHRPGGAADHRRRANPACRRTRHRLPALHHRPGTKAVAPLGAAARDIRARARAGHRHRPGARRAGHLAGRAFLSGSHRHRLRPRAFVDRLRHAAP